MCITEDIIGDAGVEFGADSGGPFDLSRSMNMWHWPSDDTTITEFFPVFVIYGENQTSGINRKLI